MGFRPDVEKILLALRPSAATRQTLLFSATLPKDVLRVAEFATRPAGAAGVGAATLVDTVGDEENTHQHVPQCAVVTALSAQGGELLGLIQEVSRRARARALRVRSLRTRSTATLASSLPLAQLSKTRGHKLVVFFTTARLTQLYAHAFVALGLPVLEMHSRKSQVHGPPWRREQPNLLPFAQKPLPRPQLACCADVWGPTRAVCAGASHGDRRQVSRGEGPRALLV